MRSSQIDTFHVEITVLPNGDPTTTLCCTTLETAVPIEIDAFINELRATSKLLERMRHSSVRAARTMVMADPHLRVALTLQCDRVDEPIVGVPQDQTQVDAPKLTQHASEAAAVLNEALPIAREQAERIAERPYTLLDDYRRGFPASSAGVAAMQIIGAYRGLRWKLQVQDNEVELGGLNLPRWLPTGDVRRFNGYIPIMVDAARWKGELVRFEQDDVDQFDLSPTDGPRRVTLCLPHGRSDLIDLIAFAMSAKAPIDLCARPYGSVNGSANPMYMLETIENVESIWSSARRVLHEQDPAASR